MPVQRDDTMLTRVPYACMLALALLLGACKPSPPPQAGPKYSEAPASAAVASYRFAVAPGRNPSRMLASYQPLIDHLNRNMSGVKLEFETSRDFPAFEAKFRERTPEFLLPNPWQSIQAMKTGYHVIAIAGDAQDFKGIFVARRDSPIRRVEDLRGKVVSYIAPTALAATVMPQYYLHQHGIDVNRDIENRYVGSQESAIMNAYLRQSAVGATWPPAWRVFQREYPKEAAEMKVLWETEPLINNSVMARDDVPASVVARVRELLLGLAEHPEGAPILTGMAVTRFHRGDDSSYAPVREFIANFERQVRPVQGK